MSVFVSLVRKDSRDTDSRRDRHRYRSSIRRCLHPEAAAAARRRAGEGPAGSTVAAGSPAAGNHPAAGSLGRRPVGAAGGRTGLVKKSEQCVALRTDIPYLRRTRVRSTRVRRREHHHILKIGTQVALKHISSGTCLGMALVIPL